MSCQTLVELGHESQGTATGCGWHEHRQAGASRDRDPARRRPGGRRRRVDRLPGAVQPGPGQPGHPGTRRRDRPPAGLPGQPRGRVGHQMLAMLVHDITNPHNFGLIRGAEAQARAAGYTLVLGDTQESPELESAHAERLRSGVDGLVLAGQPAARRSSCASLPPARRWCCSTGRCRAAQRRDGFGRRQPADHRAPGRARTPIGSPTSPGRAIAWMTDERWRALSVAAGDGRGRDRPARAVPADPGPGSPRRRRRARPAGRPRWSRSTTCSPSASCSGWSVAGSTFPATDERGRV